MGEYCRFRAPDHGMLLIWELTRRCNLACIHCCSESGPGASVVDDVPTEVALGVCRSLAECGVVRLMFSGGEPLLRPDLFRLLAAIDVARVETYIATNGMSLTPDLVEKLRAAGLRGVDVSVDGHSDALHMAVRGPSASLSRILQSIRSCIDGNLPVRVTTTLTPESAQHIEAFVATMVELGVRALIIHTVQVTGGRARMHPELGIDGARLIALRSRVESVATKYRGAIEIEFRAVGSAGAWTSCRGGRSFLHIAPNGDVSPCSWLYKLDPARFRTGNIIVDELAEIVRIAHSPVDDIQSSSPGCPLPKLTIRNVSRA